MLIKGLPISTSGVLSLPFCLRFPFFLFMDLSTCGNLTATPPCSVLHLKAFVFIKPGVSLFLVRLLGTLTRMPFCVFSLPRSLHPTTLAKVSSHLMFSHTLRVLEITKKVHVSTVVQGKVNGEGGKLNGEVGGEIHAARVLQGPFRC